MSNLDRSFRSAEAASARNGALNLSFGRWVPMLLLPAVLTLGACGAKSDSTPPPLSGLAGSNAAGTGAAAGNTGTAGVSGGGGSGGSDMSGNAGMSGAAGGAGIAVCTNYCTTIMANCTGPNQQYADMANCMKVCSYIPAGTPTDSGTDSIGCRANAAAAAKSDTADVVKSQCFGAGPLSYAVCGEDTDEFCNIAASYCPGAYKSVDDCNNVTGLQTRVIPENTVTPGLYNSMWDPGANATPDIKDTLECRAYYLFIKALASPANQTMYCPDIANMSATCGVGYVPPVIPDGGTTSDGAIPVYDGGVVSTINSTNWNETTLYPPAKRKMLVRDEGDPHLALIDLSQPAGSEVVWKTVAEGPWARAAQLIGNNQILGGTSTGYQVFDYTSGKITKTVNGFGNTQSAYRLVTGETMLTQSGTVLTFLDKTDKKTRQISYPGYGYVRVARPTRKGTFLVPSDTQLFEGDANGKVLWHTSGSGWSHIWEPLLLGPPVGGGSWKDGDTLLCNAFGSSCDVVDQVTHMITFSFGGKKMPNAAMFKPNFFSEYEILPNGNIVTANWQGHGGGNGNSGIQVIEFDPTGTVTWYWKQDPAAFSSIQGVQVMDGKNPMYLHVQETSADSTWQPVNPTP
jgi:hypothetical protein